MYCPKCGSNNVDEVKFCTRCGTNLAAVSHALTEKSSEGKQAEDWTEKLLKKYYSGRRDTVTGAGLIAGGLMIMALLVAVGMKPMAAFWILCWMFFWGVIAIADGLGKWLASGGEMKKLGFPIPQKELPRPDQKRMASPSEEQASLPSKEYSTDPLRFPGSVTEQTTRNLEERGYPSRLERKSKQTK